MRGRRGVQRRSMAREWPGRSAGYRRSRSREGFTLLEVMLAMLVLVIGAFSAFAVLTIAIQSDAESAHFSEAKSLAQREMEIIRAKTWSSMPSSGSLAGVSGLLPSGTGTVTVTTIQTSQVSAGTGLQTGLARITITINWTEPARGSDSVSLETYVTEGGLDTH